MAPPAPVFAVSNAWSVSSNLNLGKNCYQSVAFVDLPVGDEWLDVNFATSHHGDSCWVAVGVTENASDINL